MDTEKIPSLYDKNKHNIYKWRAAHREQSNEIQKTINRRRYAKHAAEISATNLQRYHETKVLKIDPCRKQWIRLRHINIF
jgi:hypothetical protein